VYCADSSMSAVRVRYVVLASADRQVTHCSAGQSVSLYEEDTILCSEFRSNGVSILAEKLDGLKISVCPVTLPVSVLYRIRVILTPWGGGGGHYIYSIRASLTQNSGRPSE
jgi:hypothetical protein